MRFEEKDSSALPSGIEFATLFQIVRRRLYPALFAFLAIVCAVTAYTFTATPVYRATSTVLISKDSSKLSMEDIFGMDSLQGSSFNTRISLLKSKKLAGEVWAELKEQGKLPPDMQNPGDLLESIVPNPIRNTRIVEVSVSSTSAQSAAECANAVSKRFIEWYSEESQRSVSFYSKQLETLEKQISDINGQTNNFVKQYGLITPEMWSTYREELSRLRELVTSKGKDLRKKERQLEQIESARNAGGVYVELTCVRENLAFAALEKTRMDIEKELLVARGTYGPKHPKIAVLEATLAKQTQDLAIFAESIVRDLGADYDADQKELTELQADLVAKEATAKETLSLLQKYSKLERDLFSTQSLYNIVLQKMKESGMSTSTDVEPTQLIDAAVIPVMPVSPKIKLNLALGILFGIVLALAFAYLLDFLDDSVKSTEDVNAATSVPGSDSPLPILGYIGRIASDHLDHHSIERICAVDPKSPFAESYRTLRTSLVFSFTQPGPKAIMFTSSGSSEGKTINVSNIGIALAQNHFRTIIVDADMRKPRLHHVFSAPTDKGLSSILIGSATTAEVVMDTGIPNLSFIPCGPIPPLANELLSGQCFRDLIAELKKSFDYIIIDSPPGIVADATVISPCVDGVGLVVRSGTTSRRHLRVFFEQLRRANAKILGVVLNDVESKLRYGYYYSYHYKYGNDADEPKQSHTKNSQTKAAVL
ncbi:MAG: polysaccharide biosynthesis tyrosine autokinase [Candidatus Brocadiia bacterium]